MLSSKVYARAPADKDLFLSGLKATYIWLAALNTMAIIPSIFTGEGATKGRSSLETKIEELDFA